MIDRFNKQGKGFKVMQRTMPSDKLLTQLQAGGEIDVIVGGVIWPAQFAANG